MKKTGSIGKILTLTLGMFLIAGGMAEIMCQMKPIKFTTETLANGLQVIYQVDKSAPVVATVVHYRVGSRDENPAKTTGYAHFFEHLMFEATRDIPRASIDKHVQEAGGDLNAHTSFDETVYYLRLPSNELKLALWIESQRMRGLLVDTIGVETQRGVVLQEMNMRRTNAPYGNWMDKMCEYVFPGTGTYNWTTLGSAEHISKAQIDDFREFYNNFYKPNNATLVIAGDFDLNETKEYVKAYFGQFEKGADPVRNNLTVGEMKGEVREDIKDEKAQLPAIFIGFKAPSLGDKDYFAVTLLNSILAAGESSRMYQSIVDKDQLAVESGAFPMNLEKSGMWVFYGIAQPEKTLADIEKAIFAQIQLVLDKGITDEELTKAKNIKEAEFISGKKDVLDKAQTLAQYNSYYGNPELINTEIDQFLKVTKEDIIKVAKKYLDTKNRAVLNYIPQSQNN